MRYCSNPKCNRPIEACFGFVKAGDLMALKEERIEQEQVRELCAKCGVKVLNLRDEPNYGYLNFLIEIGWHIELTRPLLPRPA